MKHLKRQYLKKQHYKRHYFSTNHSRRSSAERIAAEQSSATSNDTTNVQQPTAEAEKSAQEQPVVSPETTIEPLGQPTEVAPAENDANKSTSIPKEFETPDVDKAVDEAKRSKHYRRGKTN